VVYGQVVVGPPGSGKSTYCAGLEQLLNALGRPCSVINLDPANDSPTALPYRPAVNLTELVTVSRVMREQGLGPNGAMIYAMDYLEMNFDWLERKLDALRGQYLLFDFPGQIELFTHRTCVRSMIRKLLDKDLRLAAVNLVDAHYCTHASKFVSVLVSSLTIMLELELPHVNVLSKVDLVEQYGKLDFGLEFYTDVMDLDYLVQLVNRDPRMAKHAKLTQALCEVIEDYSLVSFQTLDIQDKESVLRVLRVVDKANGFFSPTSRPLEMDLLQSVGRPVEQDPDWIMDVQERYTSFDR